jgi:YHS domain-containing protein
MPCPFVSRRRCFLMVWVVVALAAVVAGAGALAAGRHEETTDGSEGDPYPLRNCVILDVELDQRSVALAFSGREIRVCCRDCASEFKRNYDRWIGVVDQRITEEQEAFYPLGTCVVDGTKLDDGSRLDFVFRNRLFRVCSRECQEQIERAPAKYFEALNRAVIDKQKPGYPLDKCVVSGKPLGAEAVDHVVANQLVRLAGANQVPRFNKNPAKYLAEVRAAAKQKPAPGK